MGDEAFLLNEIDTVNNITSTRCTMDEINSITPDLLPTYSIVTQNIRSIYKNSDDFDINIGLMERSIDIFILTECHLNPNKPIPIKTGYSIFNSTNKITKNDGIIVYAKNNIKSKCCELKIKDATCLEFTLSDIIILCIYRSPSNNPTNFINALDAQLSTYKSNSNIMIIGDININIIENGTDTIGDTYLNMLSLHNMTPAHRFDTRINSCIDHIITNINPKTHSAFVAVLETSITDHATLLMNIYKAGKCNKLNTYKKNYATKTDYNKALNTLEELNLDEVLNIVNPDTVAETIISKITYALDTNTRTFKIPSNKRITKPWITPGILRCIRTRNSLQKKFRLNPNNEITKITFYRYRNYCNNLIKRLKIDYEKALLYNNQNDNKQLWKSIKTITNTNKIKTGNSELKSLRLNPLESAKLVNKTFVNTGKILADSPNTQMEPLERINYLRNLPSQVNSIGIIDPENSEVLNIVNNLKTHSAAGPDKIPTIFIKMAIPILLQPLTHLACVCFQQGIFPRILKSSIIHPIHKGGPKDDINNYRPIAVLSVISKIIEKLINNRIKKYLTSKNLLSNNQYGFRDGRSTEEAVLALTENISKHLDKAKKTLCIFLDLKKAFDTVSVNILLQKLEKIGFRDTFLNLLTSYLTDRTQTVLLDNDTISDLEHNPPFGVPQGSVLGPTLFLIYINDLTDLKLEGGTVFSYADDTALLFEGRSWSDTFNNAKKGLGNVIHWLRLNLLTLNVEKTNYITFSLNNPSQPSENMQIIAHFCSNSLTCNCVSIKRVDSTKYLGIIIDNKLSWQGHIEKTADRIRKLSWLFKHLRHVADTKLLTYIYMTLAQSVVLYCLPIWGGSAKTRFIELERAQRAILKIMFFKKRQFSTGSLYELANVLSVRKLYVLNCVLRRHKKLIYDKKLSNKRNAFRVFNSNWSICRTTFMMKQYDWQSAQLYNNINKILNIYSMSYSNCKISVTIWLKSLNYNDVENLIH